MKIKERIKKIEKDIMVNTETTNRIINSIKAICPHEKIRFEWGMLRDCYVKICEVCGEALGRATEEEKRIYEEGEILKQADEIKARREKETGANQ